MKGDIRERYYNKWDSYHISVVIHKILEIEYGIDETLKIEQSTSYVKRYHELMCMNDGQIIKEAKKIKLHEGYE